MFRRNQKGFIKILPIVILLFLVVGTVLTVQLTQKETQTRIPAQSSGVSLYVQPSNQTVTSGEIFNVQVRANANATLINVVSLDMTYPTNLLEYQSFSDAGSSFPVPAESTAGGGAIIFIRSVPGGSTGVAGDQLVTTLTFRFIGASGTAALNFTGGSEVYEFAPPNANVLTNTTGGTYSIALAATNTPVPTATPTPIPQATATPTAVPQATNTPIPGATATPTPVPGATATPTPRPANTPVPGATATPVPNTNTGGNTNTGNTGPIGGSVCSNQAPLSAPDLFRIDVAQTQVTLNFAPAKDPVSYYYITYGFANGDDRFGTSFNSGHSDGSLQHTIKNLGPNTTYYFKVRAGNGCATGDWSKTIAAKTNTVASVAKTSFTKTQPTVVTTTTNQTFNRIKPSTAPKAIPNYPSPSPSALAQSSPTVEPIYNFPVASPIVTPEEDLNFFERIGQFFANIIKTLFRIK